jgi:hypothetical protein
MNNVPMGRVIISTTVEIQSVEVSKWGVERAGVAV